MARIYYVILPFLFLKDMELFRFWNSEEYISIFQI